VLGINSLGINSLRVAGVDSRFGFCLITCHRKKKKEKKGVFQTNLSNCTKLQTPFRVAKNINLLICLGRAEKFFPYRHLHRACVLLSRAVTQRFAMRRHIHFREREREREGERDRESVALSPSGCLDTFLPLFPISRECACWIQLAKISAHPDQRLHGFPPDI
jgi:hypothetical protein